MKMFLISRDNMIKTLFFYWPNHPFYKRILPRTFWSRNNFSNSHVFQTFFELFPIHSISIPHWIFRSRIPQKRFNYLLTCPLDWRVGCNIKMNNFFSVIAEDYENKNLMLQSKIFYYQMFCDFGFINEKNQYEYKKSKNYKI